MTTTHSRCPRRRGRRATAISALALVGGLATSVIGAAPSRAATPPAVSFGPTASYAVGDQPTDVTVADFNNDGIADLAVAVNGCPTTGSPYFCSRVTPGGVAIRLGTGKGTFGQATLYPAGPYPIRLKAGDFNGDGNADVAVTQDSSTDVFVLLGTGTGSLGPPVTSTVGPNSSPLDIAVADFNSDGIADLAVTTFGTSGVSVLLGTGTGTFGAPTNYPTGTWPQTVAVGDFNNDGVADLAVADMLSQRASVLLGTGTGTFLPAMNVTVVGNNPYSVGVGDFNGDGNDDLAVTMLGTAAVSVSLGNGDGTFGAPTSYPAGDSVWRLVVADFNNDGVADLAVTNSESRAVSVLAGTGTGSFVAPVTFPAGSVPEGLAVGDFNGDGLPDLVATNRFSDDVSVLLNGYPTLSCRRVTAPSGSSYLQCRATALAGIRRTKVIDLGTRLTEQSTAFSCSADRQTTSTGIRIPDDGNSHRVVVAGCATGVSRTFLVAPDGSVTPQ
jgi:hypothetical protein